MSLLYFLFIFRKFMASYVRYLFTYYFINWFLHKNKQTFINKKKTNLNINNYFLPATGAGGAGKLSGCKTLNSSMQANSQLGFTVNKYLLLISFTFVASNKMKFEQQKFSSNFRSKCCGASMVINSSSRSSLGSRLSSLAPASCSKRANSLFSNVRNSPLK